MTVSQKPTGDLERGKIYRIRLTDGFWTDGKFLRLAVYNPHFNPNSYFRLRSTTHFLFENVRTGRTVEIKSRQRIRERIEVAQ